MKKIIIGFKKWVISNKKTLIQLCCWLLFIVPLVLFVRSVNKTKTQEKEESMFKIEELQEMNNYIYECLYNDLVYTGRVFSNGNEEMYIEHNGEIITSYYDTEWYEIRDGERVSIHNFVERIKPSEIYEIIKESELVDSKEVDGFTRYQYKISSNSLGYETSNYIYINVYVKDNKIVAADLLGQYCAYNLVEGE